MQKVAFIKEYRSTARRLNGTTIAGNWMRLAESLEPAGIILTPAEAAKWAARGYLPEEAGRLILDGITADRQGELEDHAAAQVGGHEALAALRIAELHAAGMLGPDDVVTVQDPFRAGQQVIVPRSEL